MKKIIIAVLAILCIGASRKLKSPREAGDIQNEPMLKLQPLMAEPFAVEQVRLSWSYPLPMPQPNLVFDIQHRDNMNSGSWAKVGETTAPPFFYSFNGKKSGFFQVISRSTATTNTTANLSWIRPVDGGGVGYKIYRGPVPLGAFTVPGGATTTNALVSNVSTTTVFMVTAVDATSHESPFSNPVTYTPTIPAPVYPVTSLTIIKL